MTMLHFVSTLSNRSALQLIERYQRHISPIKGFKCPSGQLYGKTTCSAAVKNIVKNKGIIKGIPAIYQQFSSCKKAAQQLSLDPTQPMSVVCCCVLPVPL
jgi:putative component of membrane protein insertase Oxa1/YidC/SpoIIIJ protein YidD